MGDRRWAVGPDPDESPRRQSARPPGRCPASEDLSAYRYHTGATLRPLADDEPCPVLFRDLGPVATALFLRGALARLAGPQTPLLYMRTAGYREPYTDYEEIGRLVMLRPRELRPWFSGVPGVYVARASVVAAPGAVGYAPGGVGLEALSREAAAMRSADELREHLGGREYDERLADARQKLSRLSAALKAAERRAEPLRARLRSPRSEERLRARDEMAALGLTEEDLCAAWHHLPRERRAFIREALKRLPPGP